MHMFGTDTKPNKARGDALQPRHGRDQSHHERHSQRFAAGLQRNADDVVLGNHLHPLRHPHRKFAALPYRIEFALSWATTRKLCCQEVRGRDRVLHREIDADAADRRHRMRGVADAQQAWLRPARQPVDRNRQQLDRKSVV